MQYGVRIGGSPQVFPCPSEAEAHRLAQNKADVQYIGTVTPTPERQWHER